jgi:hypothetical protein
VHKIDKRAFGYHVTFGGFITKEEMEHWVSDARKALVSPPPEFGVFVDMRTLKPLPKDAQATMEAGQKLFKQAGMVRSVVILDNAITTYQFREIARASGISQWERYINASSRADWQRAGEEWLSRGVDPDKAGA